MFYQKLKQTRATHSFVSFLIKHSFCSLTITSTGLGQEQVVGPIVSYCASPVHCTNPGLLPVQCEYAITGIVLITSSRTAIKNGSCQDSFGG